MRKAFVFALLIASSLVAGAQIPSESVRLEDMTFVRQSFCRNFYNSGKLMSSINMNGTDLFLENAANLVVDGDASLSQKDGGLVFHADAAASTCVRVGAFHPYLCYEAEFEGLRSGDGAGIEFGENNGNGRISVIYRDGSIVVTTPDGKSSSVPAEATASPKIRVQYTGMRFHVFVMGGEGSGYLKSFRWDMRAADTPVKWSWKVATELAPGSSVSLKRAESKLSCGTGQADPQIVQHADGTPMIKDGRLYVCFTTRGFEQIPDSYQGVYSLDISSFELRLEGALFFGERDGIMHGYHATKVVYDDRKGKFMVITTTHGGTHSLAWCETSEDLLHGMHYLECTELDFPHNRERGGTKPGKNETVSGAEDPDFFYDAKAGKWRLAYCAYQGANKDGKHLSYVTHLCESKSWNGPYKLIATSKQDNNTGIRIVSVGGKRLVLSGGSDVTFYIYDYPTLDYIGTFRQEYANGGFRGWPTIVPIPYGNYERYLWITFDRGALTGRYSYGTLYFYLGDKMLRK